MAIVKDQSSQFELNLSSKLRENNVRKTSLSHKLCAFRCLEFSGLEFNSII